VFKIGIEKAQLKLIIVLFSRHNPFKHKELGLAKTYYDTRPDVINVLEI
jgi:hypothetical protein